MRKQTLLGFTLTEAMLTLGLFLLGLGVLSSLLGDFNSFYRRFFRGDAEVVQAPVILEAVAKDVWESAQVLEPTAGDTSDFVTLEKADPRDLADRLNRAAPATPGALWNTTNVRTLQVRWQMAAGQLSRVAPGDTRTSGRGLQSFSVTRAQNQGRDILDLVLEVKREERTVTWTRKVVKRIVW